MTPEEMEKFIHEQDAIPVQFDKFITGDIKNELTSYLFDIDPIYIDMIFPYVSAMCGDSFHVLSKEFSHTLQEDELYDKMKKYISQFQCDVMSKIEIYRMGRGCILVAHIIDNDENPIELMFMKQSVYDYICASI